MSKCKITGNVLAIQLGRENTQIVLMGKGTEILHSVCIETPAGAVDDGMIRNTEAVREMLKTALKEEPAFKRVHQAVFSLCTSQAISETVVTPSLAEAKLEKLLEANVDMYFPVDMKDYQLVWQTIGPNETETDLKELLVQLWAVPKAMLAPYYRVANDCGLSVLAVDYCGHSLATAVGASFVKKNKAIRTKKPGRRAFRASDVEKQDASDAEKVATVAEVGEKATATQMYLTLEKDLLGMSFVQNSRVVYQRFICCGSDPVYQLSELAMMLDYFQSLDNGRGSAITGYVSGALCADRFLVQELQDMLGMDLFPVGADMDPRLVMCIGAARTNIDYGNPSLNKPGKARRELQSQLWQYALILAGGLALIAVVMMLLSSRLVWDANIGRLESTRQTLTIQAQKTAGFADNYNAYSSKYDSYSADWDTIFSSLRTYNDNLVLVLDELESIMPKSSSVTDTSDGDGKYVYPWPTYKGVAITGLQIAADGMNIQFACESKEQAAYLIMALRELKYMDLLGITDLQGGGAGPATSYGSVGTEAPPTEGSSAGNSVISNLISSELSQDKLSDLAKSLTPGQIDLLEQNYGKKPSTLYPSLAALKEANTSDEEVFFTQRSAALREMLTTNPFAVDRFREMLLEDFERGNNSILLIHIMADLVRLQKEGVINSSDDLVKNINVLVDLMVQNDVNLSASEELLCKDDGMEAWYVYYLEVQTGAQQATKFPFLDMNKIVTDLMDGSFNTGDDDLDEKLNGLISDETRNLLKSMNSDEEMGAMVSAYFTDGTSGSAVVDALIKSYLTTGTTGIDAVDGRIKSYVDSGAMDDEIADLVEKYMTTGTTGNETVNQMIEKYLTTGTTGNPKLDGIIDGYMSGSKMNSMLAEMAVKYLTTNTTGNQVFDRIIQSYVKNGTTGNTKLDAKLDQFFDDDEDPTGPPESSEPVGPTDPSNPTDPTNPADPTDPADPTEATEPGDDDDDSSYTDAQVEDMMKKYLTEGTTGNKVVDKLIKKYLTKGTTGIDALDKKIEAQIKSGSMNRHITTQVNKYVNEGTTGNDTLDGMVESYFTTGTTGNKSLDKIVENYIDFGYLNDEISNMMIQYILTGTTGNKNFDTLVKNYMKNGTTGNEKIDALIKNFVIGGSGDDDKEDSDESGPTGTLSADQVAVLLKKWIKTGTTGNTTLDGLFSKYAKDKTTGVPALDSLIKEAITKNNIKLPTKPGSNSVTDALDKLTGSGSDSSSDSSLPQDTRVFFNAILGYNDELKNAELTRKGLSYSDKIGKVEVED